MTLKICKVCGRYSRVPKSQINCTKCNGGMSTGILEEI